MSRTHPDRGFTLIETVVVLGIVLLLATLAGASIFRQRPRARLASTAAEVQSLIHSARQQALSTSHDVWVVVFPVYANGTGTGRILVYEDGNFDFATAGAPGGMDLGRIQPGKPQAGSKSRVLSTMDFPAEVLVGTDGSGPSSLARPLDGIDLTQGCTFCGTTSDRRGAIRFDARGRAHFYAQAGTPLTTSGAALSLTASPAVTGTRTLVITPVTGIVRLLTNG